MGSGSRRRPPTGADLVVVGAGIVGLAHALEAGRRGLSVIVVERDDHARGASVRNFGHCFMSAQTGDALDFALEARTRWRELAAAAGFWLLESGTLLVARLHEELDVIREFAAMCPGQAHVLGPAEVLERAPVASRGLLGGLWTPLDYRVDAREALPALARWLEQEQGVAFLWRTTAFGAEPGVLATSRGDLTAEAIVIAAGHDVDGLHPESAANADLRRCSLHMLRVALPDGRTIVPALATGLALLRYGAFGACPSLPTLRARIERDRPELLAAEVNLLVTQRADGDLVIGDTHTYAHSPTPFRDERLDDLLLAEVSSLLDGAPLAVRERWHGTYAHAPGREFLVTTPAAGVRAVVVTSGIGMTTALGLAPSVLSDLFEPSHATP